MANFRLLRRFYSVMDETPAAVARDLSPREAAIQTGLSRTLIYREVERGHLRAYKVGGRLRITPEALLEWKRLHAVTVRSERPAYEPIARASDGTRSGFADELRSIRTGRAA
jgi:excisionase family DNA binding protein